MRKFGYARVSSSQQCLNIQIKALKEAGVEEHRIFCDIKSGANLDRPGLDTVLMKMERGDELYIHKIDRLGRDTPDMLQIIKDLKKQKIVVYFISEGLSTGGSMGPFVITILCAASEADKNRMMERLNEGKVEAIARGVRVGPKFKIDRKEMCRLWKEGYGATEISKKLNMDRSHIYQILKEENTHF